MTAEHLATALLAVSLLACLAGLAYGGGPRWLRVALAVLAAVLAGALALVSRRGELAALAVEERLASSLAADARLRALSARGMARSAGHLADADRWQRAAEAARDTRRSLAEIAARENEEE